MYLTLILFPIKGFSLITCKTVFGSQLTKKSLYSLSIGDFVKLSSFYKTQCKNSNEISMYIRESVEF